MAAKDYYPYKKQLIPDILQAYNSLAEEYDVIIIEGAGSPAEINLRENDIVNMGMAEMVDAPVLLVGDIDRGGVFASLYGTVALLQPEEQKRIKGLIINKFRGDVEILKPGLDMMRDKLPIPFVGVIPYLHLDIDDEDSLSERLQAKQKPTRVGYCRHSSAAHFEFHGFRTVGTNAGRVCALYYANDATQAAGFDFVAGQQEYNGRSQMDAAKWLGSCGQEICGFRYAGIWYLRRLPDDGSDAC